MRRGRRPVRRRRGPPPSRTRVQTPQREAEHEGSAGAISLPSSINVAQLAQALSTSAVEVIKDLMRLGVMATINQLIPYQTAAQVATLRGFTPQTETSASTEEKAGAVEQEEDPALLSPRPPVVTILGHVDHGKTTLLDAIRKSKITAKEVGGITQHVGAYKVTYKGQPITFLDTPGHQAFTAMRARGAKVTDIAILVVAADDGVMPQTVEAIDHARAAGVPIVVAINKMDRPGANPERVKQQLAEHGLVLEEWGGDVITVPISAKAEQGLDDLLDNILVVAEVAELKANPNRPASGVIIEARRDESKGTVATVLIQRGTLNVGDAVVVGTGWGKIKAMMDDTGRRVRSAGPATPVEVLGLNILPEPGDSLAVFVDDQQAKVESERRAKEGVQAIPAHGPTLEEFSARAQAGEAKELNVILKTDVQGSLEPIRNSLERLSTEQTRLHIIHASSGSITESDVLLAQVSKAIIIGFNSRPEPGAMRRAETEGVDIRYYDIIYNLVEELEKALEGLLKPAAVEITEGHAEIRAVFSVGKRIKVAGVFVKDGRILRNARVRVIRGGSLLHDGTVSSLRRVKEDVREVAAGLEAGVGIEGFADFQEGDLLEVYRQDSATR